MVDTEMVDTEKASATFEKDHEGKKPFECNICRKSFVTKGGLKKHQSDHKEDKPQICDICGKKHQ